MHQHHAHGHAQRVQVYRLAVGPLGDLVVWPAHLHDHLRSSIARCASQRFGGVAPRDQLGEAKVSQADVWIVLPALGPAPQQHVVRFQVPKDDAPRVQLANGLCELCRQTAHEPEPAQLELDAVAADRRSMSGNVLAQIPQLTILHHQRPVEVRPLFVLAVLVAVRYGKIPRHLEKTDKPHHQWMLDEPQKFPLPTLDQCQAPWRALKLHDVLRLLAEGQVSKPTAGLAGEQMHQKDGPIGPGTQLVAHDEVAKQGRLPLWILAENIGTEAEAHLQDARGQATRSSACSDRALALRRNAVLRRQTEHPVIDPWAEPGLPR
mmetsp:Transcript_68280/g.220842  ORF Transcript_68280/g.220842 Transcript_68280/m.220842 type:complete len:320 (-) Transcript_68280:110-1069(-)